MSKQSLDEIIDTALHPERNGLLIKEQVAEGANHEWLVKRELKAAIVEAVEAIIGEDEPNPRNGSEWKYGFEYRNRLRTEQRTKLAKLKGQL